MSTQTIPESIVGVPLYIPDPFNFFSIGSGELPNGEDCLVIHGDVSRDYKAFMIPPVVTPRDVFLNRINSTGAWSMSFWFKGANVTYAAQAHEQVLFGVMTRSFSDSGSTSSTPGGYRDWMWSVLGTRSDGVADTSNIIRFKKGRCRGGGSPSYAEWNGHATVEQNKWIFVVIDQPVATTGQGAGNGGPAYMWTRAEDAVTEVRDVITSGGIGSASTSLEIHPDQYFSIGAYSDAGAVNGRAGEWRMAKLAFHDHILNLTERAYLFNSMVGVF